jgi:putative glutamine amidotransferase
MHRSIIQDIPSQVGRSLSHYGTHNVTVEPGSLFTEITRLKSVKTNSIHHQAVKKVGDGLKVIGNTSDGIVELSQSTDPETWWALTCQFHPEMMLEMAWCRKLFGAFVVAAKFKKTVIAA